MPIIRRLKDKKSVKKDIRATSYNFILYPENLVKYWQDVISSFGYAWALSPLHDHDIYESDKKPDKNGNGGHKKGDIKKPHYHGTIYFGRGTKKSVKQVSELLNQALIDNTYILEPQPSRDMQASIQYFIHLNDKGKYQYSKDDVQAFNGFDVTYYLQGNGDIDKDLIEIYKFIDANELFNFHELVVNVIERRPELFKTLNKKTYQINSYIISALEQLKNNRKIAKAAGSKEAATKLINSIQLVVDYKEKEELEYEKEFAQILKENEKNKKTTENSKPALTKKKDKIFKQKNHYVNSETGEIVDFARVNKNFESSKIISFNKNFITSWKHTKP